MLSIANFVASGLILTVFMNPSLDFLSLERFLNLGLENYKEDSLTSAGSFLLNEFNSSDVPKKNLETSELLIKKKDKVEENEFVNKTLPLEQVNSKQEVVNKKFLAKTKSLVFDVPFYSQFLDIEWPDWRRNACGVVSLAMIIEMYYPDKNSPQKLLEEGISLGYYLNDLGWTHQGLVSLAQSNNLKGKAYDLANNSMELAFIQLLQSLERGPVIASVYYGFDSHSPIPHLVVIKGVENGFVYYNDPAEDLEGGKITVAKFKTAWKKRFIAISK
jgi:uncharacterized protein YvpB